MVSGLAGRYPRQTLVLVISSIILIAVIAAVYFLVYLPANTPLPAEDPANAEAAAAEQARNDISPGAAGAGITPAALGSGASASSDWYQLRFTNPILPTDKSRYSGGLDADLVALMNRATSTIDVAVYDFDLLNVAQAMADAKTRRRVAVRMVTDSDTLKNTNPAIQKAFLTVRNAGIEIVEDNRGPIMHDKFTVVDREWVQTGSWNYTEGDTYRLNNNAIIIKNRELAANYSGEFEKMFTAKQFGPNKPAGVPNPQVTIGSSKIQTYFSAQDKPADKIIATIKTAQRSIYFMAYSFTHDGIAAAMTERARAGVTLGGVFETTGSNTIYSEYNKLKALNLARAELYTDGNPYIMHHKVIIVDERITIFGSFNFSDNANTANDENLLIVDDASIARAFKQEYDRVLELAKNPPVKKK